MLSYIVSTVLQEVFQSAKYVALVQYGPSVPSSPTRRDTASETPARIRRRSSALETEAAQAARHKVEEDARLRDEEEMKAREEYI